MVMQCVLIKAGHPVYFAWAVLSPCQVFRRIHGATTAGAKIVTGLASRRGQTQRPPSFQARPRRIIRC